MSDLTDLAAAEAHCQDIEQIPAEERSAEDLHTLTLWCEIKRLRNTEVRDGGLPPFSGPTGSGPI